MTPLDSHRSNLPQAHQKEREKLLVIDRLGIKTPNEAINATPSRYDAAGDMEYEYYADQHLAAAWHCDVGQVSWYRVDSLDDYLSLLPKSLA